MAEVEYEYGKGVPTVIMPSMAMIESMVDDIRYRGQLISRNQKLESGVGATGIIGFSLGFLVITLMIVGPLVMGG